MAPTATSQKSVFAVYFIIAVLTISGCSSKTTSTPLVVDPDPVVASVKISPGAVTLLALDESFALSVVIEDDAGATIDTAVTWTSSDPAIVSVDASGQLLAMGAVGSAMIGAAVDGVQSVPVLVIVALAANGVRALDDTEIVGNFEVVDPAIDFVQDSLYRVTLTGITAPVAGTLLIGTGEQPLLGEVVDVVDNGTELVVTMRLLPLARFFDELIIDRIFDLSSIEPVLSEATAEFYTIERLEDGSHELTLIPGSTVSKPSLKISSPQSNAVALADKFALGPFECETNNPTLPLTFNALPAKFNFENKLEFVLRYFQPGEELKQLGIDGELTVKLELNPTLDVAFTGKIECKIELGAIPIPVNGFLSAIFGTDIPFGVGAELGGRFTVGKIGFASSTEIVASPEIGLECPLMGDCQTYDRSTREAQSKADWVLPSIENLNSQFRLEATAFVFGFAEIAIGSKISKRLRFKAFEIKAGIKQSSNLGTVEAQIADDGYASDYGIALELQGGLAGDAISAFDLISINANPLEITSTIPLFESPKAAAVTVDWARYKTGDTLNFNVALNPDTVEYPTVTSPTGEYNVADIIIYQIDPDAFGTEATELLRTTAADAQQSVDLSWVADADGDATDIFYAFVSTKALGIDVPGLDVPFVDELELGKTNLLDTDGDLMPDGWELKFGLDPFVGNAANDRDGDELSDQDEYLNDTDPTEPDTDGDQMPDGWEVRFGLDPLTDDSADDPDMDGFTNLEEFNGGTNPVIPEVGSQVPRILFTSDRSGNDEIFAMNSNGLNQVNLSAAAGNDFDAAGSADGIMIAFVSDRDGNREIYSMRADGSDQQNLSNYLLDDTDPAWSPDGSQIAFVRWIDGNREIFTMNADGTAQQRLTNNVDSDSGPSWSPDGLSIAFRSDRTGDSEIFVMAADGSSPQNLSNNAASDSAPAWSPDGARIAFVSNRDADFEIYTMAIDGTNQQNLSNNLADDNNPTWSPTANKIVFDSTRDGNAEVYMMDADGLNPQNLSANAATDSAPSWFQNRFEQRIAFVTSRQIGSSQFFTSGIYMMNLDGSDAQLVTQFGQTTPRLPAWSPNGARIAYIRRDACNLPGSRCDFVYLIDRDGSNIQRIGAPRLGTSQPAWSPDGSKIAFTSSDGNTLLDVYVMDVDGTNVQNLSNSPGEDRHPDWSADGSKIVFRSTRDGFFFGRIMVMDADGLNQIAITDGSNIDDAPSWSPDGTRIVFHRFVDAEGRRRIYVMDANGGNVQALTSASDGGNDENPDWSPDGTKIVFKRRLGGAGTDEIFIMNADGSNQQNITNNIGIFDVEPAWSP